MSCYLRHLNEFLVDLGFKVDTKDDRKEIDLKIREVIGKTSEDRCNMVWKELKVWLSDEEKKSELRSRLKTMIIQKKISKNN